MLHGILCNILLYVCKLCFFFTLPQSFHSYFLSFGMEWKSHIQLGELRTLEHLPLEYRKVEIIHKVVNILLGPAIIPMYMIVSDSTLFCNVTLITRWNEIDWSIKAVLILWTSGLFSIWVVLLEASGRFHIKGKGLLASWRYWDWSQKEMTFSCH
jgi:hypothetical protein